MIRATSGEGGSALEADLLPSLFDNLSTIVAYWDTGLCCRFANRAYERAFGISRDAVMGRHFADLSGPLYAANAVQLERVLSGEPQELAYALERPHGAPVHQHAASYVPHFVDGNVVGFFLLIADGAAAKSAEPPEDLDELHQSYERSQLALQGGDLGSWDWNVKTGEVVFNARWAEMRGYRPDEIKPHIDSCIDGIHPDDRPRMQAALNRCFEGHASNLVIEYRVRTKPGGWMWVLDRGRVFGRDEAGRPLRIVGTELDVSERKRVEFEQAFLAEVGATLAKSLSQRDTLGAVAQLALRLTDCVVVALVGRSLADRTIVVVHADPTRAHTCELLRQLWLAQTPRILGAAIDAAEPTILSSIFADEQPSSPELHALRALDVRSLMAIPLVARERRIGSLLFLSSTTARRDPAEDLGLAGEFAQRAALAIDNAQLYESARRATHLRDEVLGVVAHDLRNPLSTILMQVFLMNSAPGPRQGEAIARAVTRMNRLIQDLLDVTRIDAGRLPLSWSRLAVHTLVADVIAAQEALVTRAGLTLRASLSTGVGAMLPDIVADRDRLIQVFENVIGNAVKFTAPGGVVTLSAAAQEREVVFAVSDTGIGIAEDELPLLFERFWQAKRSHAHSGSLGLGLAIVRSIVESHGGRIWVDSEVGRGTTVSFTMPCAT